MQRTERAMPRAPEPKEIPTYTAFVLTSDGEVKRVEYIGNDHEDVLKQVRLDPHIDDCFLIFIGAVPEAIWMG